MANDLKMRPPVKPKSIPPLLWILYGSLTLPTLSYLYGKYRTSKKYNAYEQEIKDLLEQYSEYNKHKNEDKNTSDILRLLQKQGHEKSADVLSSITGKLSDLGKSVSDKFSTITGYAAVLPEALRQTPDWIQYMAGIPLGVLVMLPLMEYYKKKLTEYSNKRRKELESKLEEVPELMFKSSGEYNFWKEAHEKATRVLEKQAKLGDYWNNLKEQASYWLDVAKRTAKNIDESAIRTVQNITAAVSPYGRKTKSLAHTAGVLYSILGGTLLASPIILSYLVSKTLASRAEKERKKRELILRNIEKGTINRIYEKELQNLL